MQLFILGSEKFLVKKRALGKPKAFCIELAVNMILIFDPGDIKDEADVACNDKQYSAEDNYGAFYMFLLTEVYD